MAKKRTAASIQADITKGTFRPHTALSNMALAYYQEDAKAFAKTIFPICPVTLSSDNYYIFNKEDLLRDNWRRKPAYGKVDPAVLSEHTDSYACQVDQMIMGIDRIRQTDLSRRQGAVIRDPRAQRTKTMAGQANIHQDLIFSQNFFKSGVWSNQFTGVDSTTVTSGQFIKFSNGNSDPVALIDQVSTKMEQETGRRPNRLALGVNVYNALKIHTGILERVKYGGSTQNPAKVTENVLPYSDPSETRQNSGRMQKCSLSVIQMDFCLPMRQIPRPWMNHPQVIFLHGICWVTVILCRF